MAYRGHVSELHQLSEEDAAQYTKDIRQVMSALVQVYSPDKINLGSFYDLGEHLHFHLVPKYVEGPQYGSMFIMTTEPRQYLTEQEYADTAAMIRNAL